MSKEANKPIPNTVEAIGFLKNWRKGGPWVLTAIPPNGGNTSTKTFAPAQETIMKSWIDANQGKFNLYFTVNPIFHPMNKKPKKSDIRGLAGLHVDVDPRVGEDLQSERDRALKILRAFEPIPTVIIDSGGGYQGFWLLDEEELINASEKRLAELEAYNIKIEEILQADRCHNIDRIMRLPGTINTPNEKKIKQGRTARTASIVDADWSRVYNLSNFAPSLCGKSHPITGKHGKGGVKSGDEFDRNISQLENFEWLPKTVNEKTMALIIDGCDSEDTEKYTSRSEALFAALCMLVRADCSDEQMEAVILNQDYGISAHVLDQPQPQRYAVRQIERAKAEAFEPELAEMNSRHAIVKYGGKVRVLTERDSDMPEFLARQGFEDWYANRKVATGSDKDGKPVTMPLAKWWLSHRLRRSYEKVEFLPGTEAPSESYNLWRGLPLVPAHGDCGLYLELVLEVIAAGDHELNEYILNWMALKFQHPELKLETSLALRGGQGIGKSLFAELFGELFGQYFIAVSDLKGLTGNFNAHLQQALLVFGDEILASSNINLIGRLKTLVTQTHVRIEPKGVDSFSAPNYFSLILASNNAHIVSTDADDRRWIVLDVSPAKQANRKFFTRLIHQWKNGGREAFAYFLLNRDLSNFEHRDKPQTDAHTEQIEASFTGAARAIHEMLVSGETPDVLRNGEMNQVPQERGNVFIPSGDLAAWAITKGHVQRSESGGLERAIGKRLKQLARSQYTDRIQIAGKSARGVWLPKLELARAWWCEMHGRSFDWDGDGNAEWDVIRPLNVSGDKDLPF